MKWTGDLTAAQRKERDALLLDALRRASNGGAQWVEASSVVHELPGHQPFASDSIAPAERMSVQAIGRVLARLADEGRCDVRRGAFAKFRAHG
jgi:hypothetical protein